MADSAYELISTQTLSSAAASVTFSSIPQMYTDLVLIVKAVNSATAGGKFQLNGDTSTNYSTTWIEGNGSSVISGRESSQSSGFIYYNASGSTYNYTIGISSFMNYSNSTTYKTVVSSFGNLSQVGSYASLWRSTSAITSLVLNGLTQNFLTGSTFTLYGIKAGS